MEPPLGFADSNVVPARMISIPDPALQRAALIVLLLYVGAFLGSSFCVLHTSHTQSGMNGPATHVSSAMATHVSSSVATHTSSAMATHTSSAMTTHVSSSTEAHAPSWGAGPDPSPQHSGTTGPAHTGVCAAVSCASAITATHSFDLGPMNRVSRAQVAYFTGTVPPDAEMVLPPPRLG